MTSLLGDAQAPISLVSLCTIALNEERSLEALFTAFEQQDYPHEKIEIILVDSGSSDKTKQIMEAFAKRADSFRSVKVLDNPKRVQPSGWNVAIAASTGDALVRIDAHALIPRDFVSSRIATLEQGESVCGGPWTAIIQHPTPWRQVLLMAEQSVFGSSPSGYRRNTKPSYVASISHGAYRREVFEKAGVFNERLLRTEDNELHFRIREAGFKILLNPALHSSQYIRESFGSLMRQKYLNGFWVGKTLLIAPRCLSKKLFVPALFVLAILVVIVLGLTLSWLPALLLAVAYLIPCAIASVVAFIQSKHKTIKALALPAVIFAIHLCYGCGTILGLFDGLLHPVPSKDAPSKEPQIVPKELSPQQLRALQLKSLEIFDYVKHFCDEQGLLIYFCGGCCIGALRNEGFIPWDDDIDAFMPRQDYERLAELWPKHANTEHYSFVRSSQELHTGTVMTKICDNTTTCITEDTQDKDMPQGVYLDILPLDGYPSNSLARRLQVFWALIFSLFNAQSVPKNHGGILALGSRVLLGVFRSKNLRYRIWRFAEKRMTSTPFGSTGFVTELCAGPGYMKNRYPYKAFASATYHMFEGKPEPLPAGYDEYLRIAFGDYLQLPPEEARIPHHNIVLLDLESA
jgi:lipopolysaccharide cholinephosphotransferase